MKIREHLYQDRMISRYEVKFQDPTVMMMVHIVILSIHLNSPSLQGLARARAVMYGLTS